MYNLISPLPSELKYLQVLGSKTEIFLEATILPTTLFKELYMKNKAHHPRKAWDKIRWYTKEHSRSRSLKPEYLSSVFPSPLLFFAPLLSSPIYETLRQYSHSSQKSRENKVILQLEVCRAANCLPETRVDNLEGSSYSPTNKSRCLFPRFVWGSTEITHSPLRLITFFTASWVQGCY